MSVSSLVERSAETVLTGGSLTGEIETVSGSLSLSAPPAPLLPRSSVVTVMVSVPLKSREGR